MEGSEGGDYSYVCTIIEIVHSNERVQNSHTGLWVYASPKRPIRMCRTTLPVQWMTTYLTCTMDD